MPNKAYRDSDIIDMTSYEKGYAAGYAEGQKAAYKTRSNSKRRPASNSAAHRRVIMRQRISGTALLAVTALSLIVIKDATFALIGIPAGLALILTKSKWFV